MFLKKIIQHLKHKYKREPFAKNKANQFCLFEHASYYLTNFYHQQCWGTKFNPYICIYNCCNDMNVEKIIKTDKQIPITSRTIIHLSLVESKINEMMTAALKPHGVSLQQFNVLRILRGQKGKPANLSTLNERMVTKMSNTTRLVDKLILKGYVERMVCPSNRRKVEINITPTGESALSLMDLAMNESEEKLLENFSPDDLWSLNKLLDKF